MWKVKNALLVMSISLLPWISWFSHYSNQSTIQAKEKIVILLDIPRKNMQDNKEKIFSPKPWSLEEISSSVIDQKLQDVEQQNDLRQNIRTALQNFVFDSDKKYWEISIPWYGKITITEKYITFWNEIKYYIHSKHPAVDYTIFDNITVQRDHREVTMTWKALLWISLWTQTNNIKIEDMTNVLFLILRNMKDGFIVPSLELIFTDKDWKQKVTRLEHKT